MSKDYSTIQGKDANNNAVSLGDEVKLLKFADTPDVPTWEIEMIHNGFALLRPTAVFHKSVPLDEIVLHRRNQMVMMGYRAQMPDTAPTAKKEV